MESAGSRRSVRVVLADDVEDMRLLLHIAMDDRPDLEVVGEASDGQEALELAAALRPDLLVLDIDMPVLDGLAALPRLRQIAPETRIVVLSAYPASLHGQAALEAGAAAYVQKRAPFGDVVEDVLNGADLLDAVLASLSVSVRAALPRDTRSPAQARRFVADALGDPKQSELLATTQLLMTELVTNVIVHTTSAPDVRVSLLPDHIHVEVADSDPRIGISGHDAPPHAVSGRGLKLVATLASAWGTVQVDGGKIVWFDVAR